MRIIPTKRGWKRLGISLATLVALALIANGFMAWRTEARLQAKFAEIRAAGDPASIADLAPEPIPADQNAAAILDALTPRLEAFAKDHVHFLDHTPLGKQFDSRPDNMPPTAEQAAAIRSIVEKYPDLEAGISAAAACDQYASRANFSLGHREFLEDILENRAQPIRNLARFSGWKMEVLVADGQSMEAAELGLKMLRIARLRNREPLLINYLVNVAIRGIILNQMNQALGAGQMPPELHRTIDEELARQDNSDAMVHSLRTERGYAGTLTASVGLDAALDGVNPAWMKMVGWPVKRLYIGALDSYDDILTMAVEPWCDVRQKFGSPDAQTPTSGHGILADLLRPALIAAYEAQARNLVLLRALRIANALAEFRDAHGREASGLDELNVPREATIDPYSGEPLKLKLTGNGWLIYSVMQNGVDDGGDFTDLKDHGLAPRKKK